MTTEQMLPHEAERNPIVRMMDGEAMADSRDIAAFFGKEHKHILEKIRNMECSDGFRRSNFRPIEINDLTGTTTSHVLVTKDGFAFVVLGFTGAKAAQFKERYIAAFNAMEAELRARPYADPMKMLNDPAAMRGLLLSYSEKVLALEEQNAALSPKAEALDRIATADGSLCITDAAKTLQVRPIELFAYLRSHGWIYRRAGTAHDVGYQSRINAGDLEHKITTVLRADGSEKVTEQVRVTPQGLAKLAQLVRAPVRAA